MRLRDAGPRQRKAKALYLNHLPTPWLNVDDAPRSLEPIVRLHTLTSTCPQQILVELFRLLPRNRSRPPNDLDLEGRLDRCRRHRFRFYQ
jgi:hypothetical protein